MRNALVITLCLLAAGCDGQLPPEGFGDDTSQSFPSLLITTASSHFETGTLTLLAQGDNRPRADLLTLSGDALVFSWAGSPAVLNSGVQDNLTWTSFDGTRVLGQLSLRLSDDPSPVANPRDFLAVDADRAWIARYGQTRLVLVDRVAGRVAMTSDLSMLSAGSAILGPRRLALVGGELWVGLGRLGPGFTVGDTLSAIARVDPSSGVVLDADPTMPGLQPIELGSGNLIGTLERVGSRVLVACVGQYQRVGDGAVEEVDIATGRRVGTAVTEDEVRGNIDAAIALDGDRLLLRVVAQANAGLEIGWTRLVEWSRSSRRELRRWVEVPDWTLTEPVLGGDGRVYVGDRGSIDGSRAAGLRIFDPSTGRELTTAPVGVGPAPYALAWRP